MNVYRQSAANVAGLDVPAVYRNTRCTGNARRLVELPHRSRRGVVGAFGVEPRRQDCVVGISPERHHSLELRTQVVGDLVPEDVYSGTDRRNAETGEVKNPPVERLGDQNNARGTEEDCESQDPVVQ